MRRWRPAVVVVVLLCGCAVRHAPPLVTSDPGRTPRESWAFVLEHYVTDAGLVDYDALSENLQPLEHFVAYVDSATPGTAPEIFGDRETTVAFHIDAYNALAMYNVIVSGVEPRDGLGFFLLQKYSVGGRYRSLYDYENKVIRRLGEPRVHFALNCASASCPVLEREPFLGSDVDRRLDEATWAFLSDDRGVEVGDDDETVYLSRIMDWYSEDFLDVAPSLVDYVNRYRHEPVPAHYRVRFLPYDWTLNAK